jgi:hypothetical protein
LEDLEPTHRNDETLATRGFLWFPGRSHLSPVGGGVTRAAVHRLAADGYDSKADYARSPDVATCRQTVEALLAPLSTAWQRMATIQKQTMRVPRRSHLSPDGGGTTRVAVHRLAADGYDSKADDARSPDVATCRQTVEALLAPLPPLGSGWLRFESKSPTSASRPSWTSSLPWPPWCL